MKLKVLAQTKNELKLEVNGEGHTFCNLLQDALLEDKAVDIAGYDQPHPLVSTSIVYIRTKKDASPEKALERALSKIRERSAELVEKLEATRGSAS